MHKQLVLSAFDKAKKEAKAATGVNMSVTALAKKISDYMLEECRVPYHEKSLRNKYNLAMKEDEILELKSIVANCLCAYLGYDSYEEFVIKNGLKKETFSVTEQQLETPVKTLKKVKDNSTSLDEKVKIVIHKNKVTLIFCSLIFLLYFGLYMINRQRWMVWDHYHYVEVPFDADAYGMGSLKLYQHEQIQNFMKVTPDCDYPFFRSDGHENLWYQTSVTGELEFFTSYGLHPETGETLKKITPYMIRKYICETY